MVGPETHESTGGKLGAALFLLIGLAALGIGLWQGWTTARAVQRATATTGYVVGDAGTPNLVSGHPTVEFRTTTGAVVRYRQNGMAARPVGTPVPVVYETADPAGTAKASGFWQLWFPVLGPVLLGVAFILVGLSAMPIEWRFGRY